MWVTNGALMLRRKKKKNRMKNLTEVQTGSDLANVKNETRQCRLELMTSLSDRGERSGRLNGGKQNCSPGSEIEKAKHYVEFFLQFGVIGYHCYIKTWGLGFAFHWIISSDSASLWWFMMTTLLKFSKFPFNWLNWRGARSLSVGEVRERGRCHGSVDS